MYCILIYLKVSWLLAVEDITFAIIGCCATRRLISKRRTSFYRQCLISVDKCFTYWQRYARRTLKHTFGYGFVVYVLSKKMFVLSDLRKYWRESELSIWHPNTLWATILIENCALGWKKMALNFTWSETLGRVHRDWWISQNLKRRFRVWKKIMAKFT